MVQNRLVWYETGWLSEKWLVSYQTSFQTFEPDQFGPKPVGLASFTNSDLVLITLQARPRVMFISMGTFVEGALHALSHPCYTSIA